MVDNINCYICNSLKTELHKEINGFSIYECKDCGLIWVPNNLNNFDAKNFYDESYFNDEKDGFGYLDYLETEVVHRKIMKDIIKTASKYKNFDGSSTCHILDIGCAFGFLLDEIRKKAKNPDNNEYTGVEISSYAYDYAKNILNLDVYNKEFNSALFSDKLFDIVFLVETIEHLCEPKEILKDINKILKPGGILVITTMDIKGLLPFYNLKPPEHLFYFSRKNLEMMLNETGYKKLTAKMMIMQYLLSDFFYRLQLLTIQVKSLKFISNFLGFISRLFFKYFPTLSVKIPTNGMIMIAKKLGLEE